MSTPTDLRGYARSVDGARVPVGSGKVSPSKPEPKKSDVVKAVAVAIIEGGSPKKPEPPELTHTRVQVGNRR